MPDLNFSFKNRNYCRLPFSQNANLFLNRWFRRIFVGASLALISLVALGKVFWTEESQLAQLKEETPKSNIPVQIFNLPSILVNFKSKEGIRMAQVSVQLETRSTSVKSKFLKDHQRLQKHLLLVLSGKEVQEMEKNKSYFENKIRSQMNVFLTKGEVDKVTLHTKMLKKRRDIMNEVRDKKSNVIDFNAKKKKLGTRRRINEVSEAERNKIIEKYYPMIEAIAKKIAFRLPANVESGDLITSGTMGLIDAIEKYDKTRDSKFKTYAEFRVRGAILDSLRSQDWVPRSIRDKAKKIQKAIRELELKLGRVPNEEEVSGHLGLSSEEFHDLQKDTGPVSLLPINEIVTFGRGDKKTILSVLEENESVGCHVDKQSHRNLMIRCIRSLPERQSIILSLYYYEGFNLRKIGQILRLTESRVSQLHSLALERLKTKLIALVEDEELKKAA